MLTSYRGERIVEEVANETLNRESSPGRAAPFTRFAFIVHPIYDFA